ncbi:prominin-1-A-like [Alligator sinensis]|uniref:Prominin-1-A-like n=1 Tax=Alligator sinensis TaxID=38654 RepID=A0A3Q0HIC2_ALLSI|nr:prominin-1-A-like [Alligator sinensis]
MVRDCPRRCLSAGRTAGSMALRNLSQPTYEPPPAPLAGSMPGLDSMARGFLGLVQPNAFPAELLSRLIQEPTHITEPTTYKQVLSYEMGFLVCAAIGLLFILLMPLGGLCFCCCRCCGHCGGRKYQKQDELTGCRRRALCTTLLLLSGLLLAWNVCAFVTNTRISRAVGSSFGTFNSSVGNLSTYLDDIPQQVDFVVNSSHVPLGQANDSLRDISSVLGSAIVSSVGRELQGALDGAARLLEDLDVLRTDLQGVINSSQRLQDGLDGVGRNLSTLCSRIEHSLESCGQPCEPRPQCPRAPASPTPALCMWELPGGGPVFLLPPAQAGGLGGPGLGLEPLSQLLPPPLLPSIRAAFAETNLTLAPVVLLSTKQTDLLRALGNTTRLTNLTADRQKLSTIPSQQQLLGLADELDRLADVIGTRAPNRSKELRDEAEELRQLDKEMETRLRSNVRILNESLQRLQKTMHQVLMLVDSVLEQMKQAEAFLGTRVAATIQNESQLFLHRLLGFFETYVAWAKGTLTGELGRCRPVAQALDGVETIACRYVLDSLNAFWFSLGACTVLLLPGLILATRLAKFYRRMDYADVPENNALEMFAPPPAFKIPRVETRP